MKFLFYLSFFGLGLFGYLTFDSIVTEDYSLALMWGGLFIMDIGTIIIQLKNKK